METAMTEKQEKLRCSKAKWEDADRRMKGAGQPISTEEWLAARREFENNMRECAIEKGVLKPA
jgi:hypothetical protein